MFSEVHCNENDFVALFRVLWGAGGGTVAHTHLLTCCANFISSLRASEPCHYLFLRTHRPSFSLPPSLPARMATHLLPCLLFSRAISMGASMQDGLNNKPGKILGLSLEGGAFFIIVLCGLLKIMNYDINNQVKIFFSATTPHHIGSECPGAEDRKNSG